MTIWKAHNNVKRMILQLIRKEKELVFISPIVRCEFQFLGLDHLETETEAHQEGTSVNY